MTAPTFTRRHVLVAAAGVAALGVRAQDGPGALARVRQRGRLTVGIYNDMPPFHVAGKGIDVDLAAALA